MLASCILAYMLFGYNHISYISQETSRKWQYMNKRVFRSFCCDLMTWWDVNVLFKMGKLSLNFIWEFIMGKYCLYTFLCTTFGIVGLNKNTQKNMFNISTPQRIAISKIMYLCQSTMHKFKQEDNYK